jgi:hypothetical protein
MLILVNGLVMCACLHIFAQAPGVIDVIGSDTTWTKAGSPYNLTGPVLVDGVTLTIEAGVIVQMNDYEILVHGTLRAIGSSTEKILFNHGKLSFSQYSSGWDEQTDSGSVFDYCVLNFSTIVSNVSLRLTNSDLGMMYLGDSSLISDNTLHSPIEVGSFNNISDNYCWHGITAEHSNFICDNNISKLYAGDSNTIHNNVIRLDVEVGQSASVYNNTINREISVGHSSQFLNNTLYGIVQATASVISNNLIFHPRGTSQYVDPRRGLFTYLKYDTGIEVDGISEISNNILFGPGQDIVTTGGYGIHLDDGQSTVFNNTIFDYPDGITVDCDATIRGNLLVNNNRSIVVTWGEADIQNNTITGGKEGVVAVGPVTIERNLITNQSVNGVCCRGPTIIRNNTITDVTVAIKVRGDPPSCEIVYNNFERYSQFSIYLESSSSNFDFKNNWWGTTDTQAINMTIRDFKYDFNSGKVNFIPILTEPNPQATSYQIPEFPSWLLLPLFLVASFVVVVFRKRLVC